MKLGIISDTHTNTIDEISNTVRKALVDVDLIVHAGDFTHMANLSCLLEIGRVKAVRGNMDSAELKRLLPEKDVFEVNGKKIGLIHGSGAPWGMTQSLVENRGFNGVHMAKRFADNYFQEPWRGYGPGPPQVFRLVRNGEAWDKASNQIYPGGSFGNGAAMHVAPGGLLFWNNPVKLKEVAYRSRLITRSYVLGMEGAVLQAHIVALAMAKYPRNTLIFIISYPSGGLYYLRCLPC